MNCDQVFDRLTRGPFPSGEDDDDLVERHLAVCHGCRQLAEALRPAVDLIHESLAYESQLPGYRGALESDGDLRIRSAVMSAIEQESAMEVRTKASTRTTAIAGSWQLVLAAALVVVLFAVALLTGRPTGNQQISAQTSIRFQPGGRGLQTLVAMNLPAVCLNRNNSGGEQSVARLVLSDQQTASSSSQNERTAFQCCTNCHSAKSSLDQFHGISLLASSCELCHTE